MWLSLYIYQALRLSVSLCRGAQRFYVVGGGGHDDVDVDEEMYVSEANFLASEENILVSKVSKLSVTAKVFRGQ